MKTYNEIEKALINLIINNNKAEADIVNMAGIEVAKITFKEDMFVNEIKNGTRQGIVLAKRNDMKCAKSSTKTFENIYSLIKHSDEFLRLYSLNNGNFCLVISLALLEKL